MAAAHVHDARSNRVSVPTDEVATESLAHAVIQELIEKTPMPSFAAPVPTPDVPIAVEEVDPRSELTTRLPPRVRSFAPTEALSKRRLPSWTLPALSLAVTVAAFAVLLAVRGASQGPAITATTTDTQANGGEAPTPSTLAQAPTAEARFMPLPTGALVSESEGWLEVTANEGAQLLVDGKKLGTGPRLGVALRGGVHEVRVGEDGARRILEVRTGSATRIDFTHAP